MLRSGVGRHGLGTAAAARGTGAASQHCAGHVARLPGWDMGGGRWCGPWDGAGAADARWRVPTGNPAHEGFVSVVTAAAFLLAAAAMVRAAFAGSWQ